MCDTGCAPIMHWYRYGMSHRVMNRRFSAKHVQSQDYLCFLHDSEVPQNMPGHYKKPVIEPVRAREIELTRIYIPAVAKSAGKIDRYIHNAVKPVIEALFGDDLICMKTKAGIEYED